MESKELKDRETYENLYTTISQLQNALNQLQIEQIQFRETLNETSKKFATSLEKIKIEHKGIIHQFEKVLAEKQAIINELAAAISVYRLFMPWSRLKTALRPHLYQLNQYQPRNIYIPEKYRKSFNHVCNQTISIVTPSFNQGIYIEDTIKSVVEQNYPALEYIIQDGGSTDKSAEIIKCYQEKLKYWESIPDKGQANALNLGFRHATGEIMAYLNSDDILLPGTLAYVANYFHEHPKIDVIYGHRIIINDKNKEIGRWVLPPHDKDMLLWADYVPQETLFWRRSIWEKVGGYIDENFQFALDWDLLLRFKAAGAVFARLPRFLGAFRFHESQKTSSNITTTGKDEMQILRKRYHGKYISHRRIKKNLFYYMIKHIFYHKLYKLKIMHY